MLIIVQQQTEISIGGGELPLLWRLILIVLAMLVLGVVVWLFRRLRRSVQGDDEWYTGEYSLLKAEAPASTRVGHTHSQSPSSSLPALSPAETTPGREPPTPTAPGDRIPSTPLIEESMPALSASLFTGASPERHPPTPSADSAGTASLPTSAPSGVVATPAHPATERAGSTIGQMPLSVDVTEPVGSVAPPQQAGAAVLPAASKPTPSEHVLGIPSGTSERAHVTTMLEVVQEITWHHHSLIIHGRVRNTSPDPLANLFAEFALVPIGVDLMETRLEPIEPSMLEPGQEGTFTLEIKANRFSRYHVTRIITAERQEVPFRCWLALSAQATELPSR